MNLTPSKNLRISIVTPSFNQGQFIERTIRSVLDQGYPDLEYFIIDGGSTDNTLEIIRKYAGRVRWISEPDSGQSNAINKGFHLATGDVVAYLNSDDTYEPGCFEAVNRYFRQHQEVNWLYGKCRIIDVDDNHRRPFITWYKNVLMRRYSYRRLLATNFINQPATFWRRSVFDEVGYLNEQEHLVMDYEFWLRLGKRFPAGFLDAYLANFRMHQTSKSVSQFRRQFSDELRLAMKFGSSDRPALFFHHLNYCSIISVYTALRWLHR